MKKCTASVLVMSYNARNTGKNLDTKESTHTHTHTHTRVPGAGWERTRTLIYRNATRRGCGEAAGAEITKRWEVN